MKSYTGEILDNRYKVEAMIGRGGMGVVYQAFHVVIGRKVAVKFLNAEYSDQKDIVTRFYREAQTAAGIGHKNIIEVLDVGISDRNEPYLVMEYLEGECLSAMLKRAAPIELAAACGILEPVLLALNAAHAKGVVHRDLKPENIFLVHDGDDDEISVKLIDFGISKLMETRDTEKLTHVGLTLGTPAYMSPEQACGAEDVDHRSDIFSMGSIFFEMLTGETPYVGDSGQELVINIVTGLPRRPEVVNPNFPVEASPIIERAMQRDPAKRFQSAQEMLDALKQLSMFKERHTQLTQYTSGITDRQCAVGDLGRIRGSGENSGVPAEVLSDISKRGTPGDWSISKGNSEIPLRTAGMSKGIWVPAALAVVLIGAVFFLLLKREDNAVEEASSAVADRTESSELPVVAPAAQPEPKAAVAAENADSKSAPVPSALQSGGETKPTADTVAAEVQIQLVGVPRRSTILYGGIVVPTDTFNVPRSDTPKMLDVEAPGYIPFHAEITPTQNLTVEVMSVQLPPSKKALPSSTPAPNPSAKPTPPPERDPSSGKYFKGKRDVEIIREFQ